MELSSTVKQRGGSRSRLIRQLIIVELEVLGVAEQGAHEGEELDDVLVVVIAPVVASVRDPVADPSLGVADGGLQLVAEKLVPRGDDVVSDAGALVVEVLQQPQLVPDVGVDGPDAVPDDRVAHVVDGDDGLAVVCVSK